MSKLPTCPRIHRADRPSAGSRPTAADPLSTRSSGSGHLKRCSARSARPPRRRGGRPFVVRVLPPPFRGTRAVTQGPTPAPMKRAPPGRRTDGRPPRVEDPPDPWDAAERERFALTPTYRRVEGQPARSPSRRRHQVRILRNGRRGSGRSADRPGSCQRYEWTAASTAPPARLEGPIFFVRSLSARSADPGPASLIARSSAPAPSSSYALEGPARCRSPSAGHGSLFSAARSARPSPAGMSDSEGRGWFSLRPAAGQVPPIPTAPDPGHPRRKAEGGLLALEAPGKDIADPFLRAGSDGRRHRPPRSCARSSNVRSRPKAEDMSRQVLPRMAATHDVGNRTVGV